MFWKIYFWLLTIIVVLSGTYILQQAPLKLLDIVGLVSGGLLLLAAYSRAFKKPLLLVRQWKYILWFQIAYLVLVVLIGFNILDISSLGLLDSKTQNSSTSADLVDIIIYIPALISLYRLSNSKTTKKHN